ncbi:hypothetical protein [Mycolicibacterium anyangense]|nr:hypothetical protein [Mycolicibacterium anyangense]
MAGLPMVTETLAGSDTRRQGCRRQTVAINPALAISNDRSSSP